MALAILFLTLKIEAQIDSKMKTKDGGEKQIFFTRDTIPYPNSFFTKYEIEVDNVIVYEIGIEVFKETDSISVQLYDKKRINLKAVGIKFDRTNDCYNIIKDYHVNEKDINDTASVAILFNIPNEVEPYVYLNIFKDISDETYYFLQNIRPDVHDKYINCMAVRDSNCNKLKNEFKKNEKNINELIAEMTLYRDTQLKRMAGEIETIMNGPATDSAPPGMQKLFNEKLDKIFSSQVGNYFSFENNDIDAKLIFEFKGNGTLSNIGKNFTNGSQQKWFIDALDQKIKPLIEPENIPTVPDKYTQPDLIPDFYKAYSYNIYHYDSTIKQNIFDVHKCDSAYILPVYSGGPFDEILKNIKDTFRTYFDKPINRPTKYLYNYRYTTTVSEVNGKWRNGKNEFEIKSSETLTPVLYNHKAEISRRFKEKFNPGSNQEHRVQICSLEINGVFTGVDINILD